MKKVLALAILLSALGIFYLTLDRSAPEEVVLREEEVLGTPSAAKRLVFGDSEYRYALTAVESPGELRLIDNLLVQSSSERVYRENECRVLVNGGFYSEDNEHLGLLVIDGEREHGYSRSALLDGVLSVNYAQTPRITREVPEDMRIAVQSGPLLVVNGSVIDLTMSRDKKARRVVAAVTGTNELVFIVVYGVANSFDGPLMDYLPEIVESVGEIENINIADAINLDGGSASAFISEGTHLTEIQTVGSYFCAQ